MITSLRFSQLNKKHCHNLHYCTETERLTQNLKIQHQKHRIVISSQAFHIVQTFIGLKDEDTAIFVHIIKSPLTNFMPRGEHITESENIFKIRTYNFTFVPCQKFSCMHIPQLGNRSYNIVKIR